MHTDDEPVSSAATPTRPAAAQSSAGVTVNRPRAAVAPDLRAPSLISAGLVVRELRKTGEVRESFSQSDVNPLKIGWVPAHLHAAAGWRVALDASTRTWTSVLAP